MRKRIGKVEGGGKRGRRQGKWGKGNTSPEKREIGEKKKTLEAMTLHETEIG